MVPKRLLKRQGIVLALAIASLVAATPAAGQTPAGTSIGAFLQGAQRVLGGVASEAADTGPQFTLPISQSTTPVDIESTNGLISLSVRDATLRQVLAALAETQNLNLIIAAPADVPVTAEFKRRPLREVLSALLSSTGHTWTENDGVMLVTSIAAGAELAPEVQGRRVSVIELDFASAADLQPAVEGLLSAVGQSHFVETNPTDNRRTKELLIVEDLDPYVTRIEHYLAQADLAPRQVLIEVNLLQVNLEDGQRCGVDFNALSRVSGARLTLGGTGAASDYDYQSNSPGFFIESSGGDLDSVIEALITTTDAKSVASPRLLAVNGQQSRIQIGERIGYLTSTIAQGGAVQQEPAFLEVGVVLELTPRITRDGRILLSVSPKVSTGAVNPETGAPDEETTELQTNALLNSGQGMVIGGLIQERDSTQINRVPLLGSLPYVNGLFQRRQVDKQRSELIVALVPHVLPYADPAVHARNEHELHRARQPLTYGPLCRNPRPDEPRLYDPYHDERRCHVFDRRDPGCDPSTCGTPAGPVQHLLGKPRRLPPVVAEAKSNEEGLDVAGRPPANRAR